jgi:lysophospholipase L1-like esterase
MSRFRIAVLCIVGCAALLVSAKSSRAERPTWKLDFNSASAQSGFTPVVTSQYYNKQTGFGFEPQSADAPPLAVENKAGFVTASQPFYFSAAVPEGNYRVTLTLGDPAGESDTTVKAELRRLMLENVHTAAGEIVTKSFIVNVRTTKFPGGEVHLKMPREATQEAWAWDEKLTLEFNGKRPCLRTMVIEPVNVPTVFILGDSTVCDQPAEPYASWGQMLPRFFKPDIAVSNNAESGETLRSSAGAHRIDKVLSLCKAGDYVLIQYGHNDMKSKDATAADEYENTLKQWCEKIKKTGASPVLITSMNRHTFTGDTVTNSLGEYPAKVRDAAKAEGVAMIDLNAMSKTLYEHFGPTGSIALFEHKADSSKFDATHHSPFGAYELAKCVIQGIRQNKLELASHILDDVPAFDPAKPDSAEQVNIPPSPVSTTLRPLGN